MRHSAPWRFFPRQRHGEDRGLMSDECEVFQGLPIAFGITALGRIKPPFLARCGGLGFSDSSTSTSSSLRDDDAQFLQPPNWNHAVASHSRNAKIRAAYTNEIGILADSWLLILLNICVFGRKGESDQRTASRLSNGSRNKSINGLTSLPSISLYSQGPAGLCQIEGLQRWAVNLLIY